MCFIQERREKVEVWECFISHLTGARSSWQQGWAWSPTPTPNLSALLVDLRGAELCPPPAPAIQRDGRALQLVNHLSPNPSFTPVLEQGSHRSNFLQPQAPLVPHSSERGRFQAEQKNQFKPQQRTASNLMKIRYWKKEALSPFPRSFSCREGAG